MYCSECGKSNNNTNNYCAYCGNKFIKKNVKSTSKDIDISLVLGIACIVSSLFLNILCFIPGIISIIYCVKRKRETGKLGIGFGLSLGGMIFSFIVLIMYILFFLLIFNFIKVDEDYVRNYPENDVEYTYNLSEV